MDTIILGAGLAGLECGRQLQARGSDFLLLEQDVRIGGLAKTNQTGEYHWDFGVHALYSSDPVMREYFQTLPLDYEHHERRVSIVHAGHRPRPYLINYPFEEGIRGLPLKDRWECICGYIWAKGRGQKEFAHLQDWIDHGLGFGISRQFMTPYNRKIWNADLKDISMDLVNAKIHPASTRNFLLAALGKDVVGRAYQSKFLYPRQGIQALADDTAREFPGKIVLSSRVTALTRAQGRWTVRTDQGREYTADKIISTIPLAELLTMLRLDGLDRQYPQLKWNDTYFVLVGLKEGRPFQLLNSCQWAFLKEQEIFYRITMMHNFSRDFLPALVAEVTDKGGVRELKPEQVRERVLADLLRLKIVGDAADVALTDLKRVPFTYPIPTVGLAPVKARITERLRRENIFLVGRNGHWDYINMDGVIHRVRVFMEKHFR